MLIGFSNLPGLSTRMFCGHKTWVARGCFSLQTLSDVRCGGHNLKLELNMYRVDNLQSYRSQPLRVAPSRMRSWKL